MKTILKRLGVWMITLTVLCVYCVGFPVSAKTHSVSDLDVTIDIPSEFSAEQEAVFDEMIRGVHFGNTYNQTVSQSAVTNSGVYNYSTHNSYTPGEAAYNTYYKWQKEADKTRIIVALVITVLLALIPGFIARGRGRRFWVWFLMGCIINPLLLSIIVLCMRKIEPYEYDYGYGGVVAAALWNCRLCGTSNEAHYKKCQNCGSERYPGRSAGTHPADIRSTASAEAETWQCANCGTENKNNYSQCKKCGKYRSQS